MDGYYKGHVYVELRSATALSSPSIMRSRPLHTHDRTFFTILMKLAFLFACCCTSPIVATGALRGEVRVGVRHTGKRAHVDPIKNSERKVAMEMGLVNPPTHATETNGMNPLGLPPEVAHNVAGNLFGGPYPSGRPLASNTLIDNPQNLPPIGPSFGIPGSYNPPSDRPRFYPSDDLTTPEAATVTPPQSFKATNKNFNPDGEEGGLAPGELEPVHPVPCALQDSQGTGICNKVTPPSKGVADMLMHGGAIPIETRKPIS